MYTGTYLILGGAGLVGTQVCRHLATEFGPKRIIVASLHRREAEPVATKLHAEYPDTTFEPAWGNLFVPAELSSLSRGQLLESDDHRKTLLDALYGEYKAAFEGNHLVQMILKYEPEVVVDCVNTATGISYQDVFDGATKLLDDLAMGANDGGQQLAPQTAPDLQLFLLSQSVPQIIRHVRFVYEATRQVRTKAYIKIGTTGTGGMGLNIPYTHSEDKPSHKLLAKTEVAFGHTGLLFLMARTPDAPMVKEIKPAAMIGYKAVEYRPIQGPDGLPRPIFEPKTLSVAPGEELIQRERQSDYTATGELHTTVVNTGENGIFTLGEFATITALGQMEFVTPEEIARNVVLELKGVNPGVDVLGAIDSTVMGPSYKAGLIREVALRDLKQLEAARGDHSIALGQLGPPELSKLLFEAHLLKSAFPTDRGPFGPNGANAITAEELSERMARLIDDSPVVRTAISVGIPVLMPDGTTLLRGPKLNIPELKGHRKTAPIEDLATVDAWANKGWIDLRVSNMGVWLDRFERMRAARESVLAEGSAAVDRQTYLGDDIEIGDVVAWIFNNEFGGYRLK